MKKIQVAAANGLPCMLYGVLCGIATGIIIFLFKLMASQTETLSRFIYSSAKGSPVYIALIFISLVACAIVMVMLHRKVGETKGGGIARSEGVLRGILSFRWLPTLVGTIFGSFISFICGVPVGGEGPSVLIGTAVGAACVGTSKNKSAWKRYIMTSGAGAGFAIATGSPLAGVLFALEEVQKRFTPMLVLTVSVAVVAATFVNRTLCSIFHLSYSLFDTHSIEGFQLQHTGYLILLGVTIALAIITYDLSLKLVNKFTARFKKYFSDVVKMIVLFVSVGVLCFVFTDGVYNGHHLIEEILHGDCTIGFLIAVLAVRFVMMILVSGSGATGGTFVPTLAIGAVFSSLIAKLLVSIGLPDSLTTTIILLGMCAFIGGTLGAPLTAIILFVEVCGNFSDLFYVALVIFTVNAITALLHFNPFFERTLDRMFEAQIGGKKPLVAHYEAKISTDCFVIGKTIRDVIWPANTLVVSIKRENETAEDCVVGGHKTLRSHDTVLFKAKYFNEEELLTQLRGLIGDEFEIHKIEV